MNFVFSNRNIHSAHMYRVIIQIITFWFKYVYIFLFQILLLRWIDLLSMSVLPSWCCPLWASKSTPSVAGGFSCFVWTLALRPGVGRPSVAVYLGNIVSRDASTVLMSFANGVTNVVCVEVEFASPTATKKRTR